MTAPNLYPPLITPPPTRRRLWPWVLAATAVAGLLALAIGIVVTLTAAGDDPAPAPAVAPQTQEAVAAVPTAEAPAKVKPKVSDFKLTPKVIDKDCFGSAGCNVTLRVDMEITGPVPSDDTSWLVVYEIHGVEDGPQVGNLTLTGSTFESAEEVVSTPSAKTKLTIKAVSIDEE